MLAAVRASAPVTASRNPTRWSRIAGVDSVGPWPGSVTSGTSTGSPQPRPLSARPAATPGSHKKTLPRGPG